MSAHLPGSPGSPPTQPPDSPPSDALSDEDDQLIRWHRTRLLTLGWPAEDAEHLSRLDLDLHLVEQLLHAGCSRPLAIRIAS